MLGFTGRLAYASALTKKVHNKELILVGRQPRVWSAGGVSLRQYEGSPEEMLAVDLDENGLLPSSGFVRALVENYSPKLPHRRRSSKSQAKLMLEEFYEKASENERMVLRANLRNVTQQISPKAWVGLEEDLNRLKSAPVKNTDFQVLSILHRLSENLKDEPLESAEPLSLSDAALFLECYFSNYIEGTKLPIGEAKSLMETRDPREKHAEGHDVVSLRDVMDEDIAEQKVWLSAKDWMQWMKRSHLKFLNHRQDKNPGEFKRMKNYAGSTQFSVPLNVKNTLERIFEMAEALPQGWKRGCFLKAGFLMVHPFEDGNGRIGRLILNHCLTEAKERRLIVPTVYRDDYILGMAGLCRGEVSLYMRMMNKISAVTSIMPVDVDTCVMLWAAKGAFLESNEGKWGVQPAQAEAIEESRAAIVRRMKR